MFNNEQNFSNNAKLILDEWIDVVKVRLWFWTKEKCYEEYLSFYQ